MVDSDGIMNQQGSILHMEMDHHNGNSKKKFDEHSFTVNPEFSPSSGRKNKLVVKHSPSPAQVVPHNSV